MMKKESPRKRIWKEFFELYHKRTELWKAGSEEYKNKDLRNEGYRILLRKFQEIDPDADVRALKRKLNTFRSNFRRELRKIKENARTTQGSKEFYVPTLWYYEYLNFLNEQEVKFEEKSIMPQYDETVFLSESDDCKQEMLYEIGTDKQDYQEAQNERVDSEEHVDTADEETQMGDKCSWPTNVIADEAEIHSRAWAVEYRKLTVKQRLLAKHQIDEILFRGRLGLLSMNKLK